MSKREEEIVTKWTQRQERTRRHFYSALVDLIKKQGFQAITVKDIVEQAIIVVPFMCIFRINLS